MVAVVAAFAGIVGVMVFWVQVPGAVAGKFVDSGHRAISISRPGPPVSGAAFRVSSTRMGW